MFEIVKYAWVTAAVDEDSVIQAAALGKSLNRVLTAVDSIVLVPDNIDTKLKTILSNYFDSVVTVDSEEIVGLESPAALDILKVTAIKKGKCRKIVVLSPGNLILQNCDEIFELEKECYVPDMDDRGDNNLPPIFVIKPNTRYYFKILDSKSAQFQLRDTVSPSCEMFPEEDIGKLPCQYNLHVKEFKKTSTRRLKQLKVMSHDFVGKMLVQDNPIIKEINEFWNSCWVEVQHFLLDIPKLGRQSSKIETLKSHYTNSIAIVGQSCRFPEVNSIDDFWELLESSKEGVTWTPQQRLELLNDDREHQKFYNGGFLKCRIEEFDANFFGIAGEEAELMDPQQRLGLEVAWEALEDAAINPHSLKGGNTAVYSAVWKSDYENRVKEILAKTGRSFTGTSASVYNILGLKGPHVAEGRCSMVALHLACESLKNKETDLGLVMGMNIIDVMDDLSVNNIPEHPFQTFEGDDNFLSEGIAVVVLKRLSDAIANGDRVLAIIRGSAMNPVSPDVGNDISQKLTIRDALISSAARPTDVDYIEIYGTGIEDVDPIEFDSFCTVYSSQRERPMIFGSVKNNIGHCESAAGLASLIKVILCIKNHTLLQLRNSATDDVKLLIGKLPAIMILDNEHWKTTPGKSRMAAINSFGPGGMNVHMLVEEPLDSNQFDLLKLNLEESERTHHILNLSARTETALEDLIDSYAKYLDKHLQNDLADLTFSANCARAHFECRASVVGRNSLEMCAALKENKYDAPVLKIAPKIAFLFAGQGCQYSGMANYLYKSNFVFRDAFDECSAIVGKKTGITLKDVLWKEGNILENFVASQLSIFAVDYSLVTFLLSLGIKPDFVIGQNVGEFVAAVTSGILDLETALNLQIKQSQLLTTLPQVIHVALDCTSSDGQALLSKFHEENPGENIHVVSAISTQEFVVGGLEEAMEKFKDSICKPAGISCKNLPPTHKFHEEDVEMIMPLLAKTTTGIKFRDPTCTFVSGATGSLLKKDEMQNGKYWLRHLDENLLFQNGVDTLVQNECNVFIEIGPCSNLIDLGKKKLAVDNRSLNLLWLPILEENKDDWEVFLNSLATLYINGGDITWDSIDGGRIRNKLELPTYPFQRQKYWVYNPNKPWLKNIKKENNENKNENISENKNENISDDKKGKIMEIEKGKTAETKKEKNSETKTEIKVETKKEKEITDDIYTFLGKRISPKSDTVNYIKNLSLEDFPYIIDHRVAELVIMPGAGFLETILAAGKDLFQKDVRILRVSEFFIDAAFVMEKNETYEMHVVATPKGKFCFSVNVNVFSDSKGWKKHARAEVYLSNEEQPDIAVENLETIKSRCTAKSSKDFYKAVAAKGIQFGETFERIETIWSSRNESLVSIPLRTLDMEGYVHHPIILDAVIQALGLSIANINSTLHLPIGAEKCYSYGAEMSDVLYCHAQAPTEKRKLNTAVLYNKNNEVVFVMMGLRVIQTSIQHFLKSVQGQHKI